MAILAALIIHHVVDALTPAKTPMRSVVVTAQPVETGQLLTETDVRVTDIPAALAPAEAVTDPAAVVGGHVAAQLPAGAPLFTSVIIDSEFLERAPEGNVVVPVPMVESGMLELITPGMRINLYAPPDEFSESGEATLIARDALVVGSTLSTTDGGFLSDSSDTTVYFVALDEKAAKVVIGTGATAPLHAVLSGPSM